MEFYASPTNLVFSISRLTMDHITEIWVRRDQKGIAEREFNRLIADGKILSATFRQEMSRVGSVNFLLTYPS